MIEHICVTGPSVKTGELEVFAEFEGDLTANEGNEETLEAYCEHGEVHLRHQENEYVLPLHAWWYADTSDSKHPKLRHDTEIPEACSWMRVVRDPDGSSDLIEADDEVGRLAGNTYPSPLYKSIESAINRAARQASFQVLSFLRDYGTERNGETYANELVNGLEEDLYLQLKPEVPSKVTKALADICQQTTMDESTMALVLHLCDSFDVDFKKDIVDSLGFDESNQSMKIIHRVNNVCCAKANADIEAVFGIKDVLQPTQDMQDDFFAIGSFELAPLANQDEINAKLSANPELAHQLKPATLAALSVSMPLTSKVSTSATVELVKLEESAHRTVSMRSL